MILQKSKRRLKSILAKMSLYHPPRTGKINMGDFNRTTPFSYDFGYDRGGPVDRYYIENFLAAESGRVKGRVLEIGDNEYTLKYGGSKLTKSDILHINDTNPKATFVGDLSDAPHLPPDTFDCIVLTQTLHLIYNYKGALETCYRILKPGGALLLTAPGISHIHHGEWGKYWMWSFTGASVDRMLSEVFETDKIKVETYGNLLVATAFLWGMGLPELKKQQMDYKDPQYQVIITATAVK
jgi:SAM-dependent methyltransferase